MNQTFSPEKFEANAIKISVLCCQEVEKFILFLGCLLPHTHPMIYQKRIGSGIQIQKNADKPNKLLSVMTVQAWLS